jgi:hypothetical protein
LARPLADDDFSARRPRRHLGWLPSELARGRARWQAIDTRYLPRVAHLGRPTRGPRSPLELPARTWRQQHASAGALAHGARSTLQATAPVPAMPYASSGKATGRCGRWVVRSQQALLGTGPHQGAWPDGRVANLDCRWRRGPGRNVAGSWSRRRAVHLARAGEACMAPLASLRVVP